MTPTGSNSNQHVPLSRDEVAGRHRSLEKSMAAFKPRDTVNSVTQALRAFEDVTRAERTQLFKGGLFAAKHEQAAAAWFAERYEHLLLLARSGVTRTFGNEETDKALRAQSCALALLLAGHALKWRRIAGNRPDANAREWQNQIFRTASAFQVDAEVLSVRIEDQVIDATVEALYARALLLDRFAAGNVSPRRLEILDNWLGAWMSALWLNRTAPAGEPVLGIDTNNPQRGLAPHVAGDGAHLFLGMKSLQRQLDRAIREFHLGRIFPGWGIGVQAPMEDHVGAIEVLEREFTLVENAQRQKAQRGKRVSFGTNAVVGVYFGFREICELAFSQQRLHTLAGGGADLGIRNAINLVDVSEGGLGLDVMEDDARKIQVGELVAVRLEKGKPCMIGTVVRKSGLQRPTATLIGIKLFSRAPVWSAMERVDEATNTWQPSEGILIAGSAADGYADSLIVSDTTYVANAPMAVTLGNQTFEVYLRRIREQGAGWRMAAFDASGVA
jgi:hypothetical protein